MPSLVVRKEQAVVLFEFAVFIFHFALQQLPIRPKVCRSVDLLSRCLLWRRVCSRKRCVRKEISTYFFSVKRWVLSRGCTVFCGRMGARQLPPLSKQIGPYGLN